ncbi:hypothetical protein ACS0TY_007514 [Phlomoides rotata]
MDGASSQQNTTISGIRKHIHKELYDDLGANKPNSMPDIGIDKLSDDLLIIILSGLNLKEAARASVLSRRWKNLWRSAITNLEFDDTGMKRSKFISWVNTILKLYESRSIDSLIIHFTNTRSLPSRPIKRSTYHEIDNWIIFALEKDKLRVVDPPNLKALEIKKCPYLQTLEISALKLASLAYEGVKNALLLNKIPNLCELTLGSGVCVSFISEPQAHSHYSVQLVKLRLKFYLPIDQRTIAPPDLLMLCCLKRLEMLCPSPAGRSLLFFASLIKASPQLREFRIEMSYVEPNNGKLWGMPFPSVSAAEAVKFDHKNLELVEMAGFVGSSSEKKFLVHLFKIASSLKRVVIDTQSDCYDDPDFDPKEHAEHLVSTFPHQVEFILK